MRHTLYCILSMILFLACSEENPLDKAPTNQELIDNYKKEHNIKTNLRMDTITTDKFWSLVDNAVKISNGNNSIKERYLITELEKLTPADIINFEIAFRKTIIDADNYKIMAVAKIIDGYVSDDSYLYFRCWLISQGKTVYTATLKDPDHLATILNKGNNCHFESLMYIATQAYSQKTNKKEDETFPREVAIKLGFDYDSFAPPTKGTDWKTEELSITYPKLWKKLNTH